MNGPKHNVTSSVGVIGIPFSKGQPRQGAELGPKLLRDSGLVDKIERFDKKVTDYGDIDVKVVTDDPPWNNTKNPLNVAMANKQLADSVAQITKECQATVVLGGDHSVAIGSISGHARIKPDMVLVWLDSHGDINTPQCSDSGNMHGMPLSFLVKEMRESCQSLPPGFDWVQPCLSAKDIVYLGVRNLDPPEREILNKHNIKTFSMHEVDKYGIAGAVGMALKALDPSGSRPIHVSFDVDAVDPRYTPLTGTPVPGGLTLREVLYFAEEVANTGRLSVLDVVEVNPSLGNEEQRRVTVETTLEIVAHFFGKHRQGNVTHA